ncbi:MAG: Rpn family recombination-promoting nuclease/putative transposase [Niameybacter sp.]|uniref:Rpn family recombination-promoting nuclease/putative transposase n=3 Tax=Niameybacter sp. TaxID=2033640 RepID=UPI002FC96162
MQRLKPTNDFIFKKLFGEEGEEIDIEVQVVDQKNMDKSTLFYWSKLYLEGIKKGQDYKQLSKVITINLVDFEFTELDKYHTSYHLWEDEEKTCKFTDLIEIHFIEFPKFRNLQDKNYREDALQRWMMFLEKDVPKEVLREMSEIEPAIKMAENKLEYLSSDPKTIALYKAREYAEHERANLYSSGLERGIEQGIEQGMQQEKYNLAKNLLDILDNETIARKTGLTIQEVQSMRAKN